MFLQSIKRFSSTLVKTSSGSKMEKTAETFIHKNYEEAINMLNMLQSNRNVLNNVSQSSVEAKKQAEEKLKQVKKYSLRSGLTFSDIDKLPVIHVSGTKGKGSTCAFCESILRHHGYKTGFFCSPHLIEVRERIRINGKPLTKETFSKYFWEVYENLNDHKENPHDMPFYFQYLFIMSLHVFLKEEVDVAIFEVGIGGEYDPTNIVTNVPVAAIASLGFDHTPILGNTIESISWNKAGIMKKGSKVFTVSQPEGAQKVLLNRSIEKQCTLFVVEKNDHLNSMKNFPSSIQTNINLALKLAETWMSLKPKNPNNNSSVDLNALNQSIKDCNWPGRYEIKEKNNIRFYIDGAHTLESMALCVDWYLNDVRTQKGEKALIFNLTGGRNCEDFFKLFSKCEFETVIFVPNVARSSIENADSINLVLPIGEQFANCCNYKNKWLDMNSESQDVQALSSVEEAIDYLSSRGRYNVLVTGSLHLVGAVSTLLNPDLNGTLRNV